MRGLSRLPKGTLHQPITGVPLLLSRYLRLVLAIVDSAEHSQDECSGFSGTGLRLTDHVLRAGECSDSRGRS